MGPEEGIVAGLGQFSDKIPPAFDGKGDYRRYKNDVELWINLTALPESKQGPALIGRLSGEPKSSAMTVPIRQICSEEGVSLVLAQLDKSYSVNDAHQLNHDLGEFLDYVWQRRFSIDQFVAGFHTRLDRLATLKMDDALKGHLMIRQANLQLQDQSLVVGAASGSYSIKDISGAMRSIFQKHSPADANLVTTSSNERRQSDNTESRAPQERRHRRNDDHQKTGGTKPSFYSYKSSSIVSDLPGAVIDSGAVASIVGKKSLDRALSELGIDKVPDAKPNRPEHRFGENPEAQKTILAIRFPFSCNNKDGSDKQEFDITFDVIEGSLPFLIGLPSLRNMKGNLNFDRNFLGLRLNDAYIRVELLHFDSHLYLPFSGSIKPDPRGAARRGPRNYYCPHDQQCTTDCEDDSGNEADESKPDERDTHYHPSCSTKLSVEDRNQSQQPDTHATHDTHESHASAQTTESVLQKTDIKNCICNLSTQPRANCELTSRQLAFGSLHTTEQSPK